jgi:hypothetical protein
MNMRPNPEAIICLQEVLHSQLEDIMSSLNDYSNTAFGALYHQRQQLRPAGVSDQGPDAIVTNSSKDDGEEMDDAEVGMVEWSYIGVGRDDGKQGGEYSPIIYRPHIWKLEHFETVWLTDTPSEPSKYPGAGM